MTVPNDSPASTRNLFLRRMGALPTALNCTRTAAADVADADAADVAAAVGTAAEAGVAVTSSTDVAGGGRGSVGGTAGAAVVVAVAAAEAPGLPVDAISGRRRGSGERMGRSECEWGGAERGVSGKMDKGAPARLRARGEIEGWDGGGE